MLCWICGPAETWRARVEKSLRMITTLRCSQSGFIHQDRSNRVPQTSSMLSRGTTLWTSASHPHKPAPVGLFTNEETSMILTTDLNELHMQQLIQIVLNIWITQEALCEWSLSLGYCYWYSNKLKYTAQILGKIVILIRSNQGHYSSLKLKP